MSSHKKHIVLVAYYFPPINHIAARRMQSFVDYLSPEKYQVSVVTSAKSNVGFAHFVDGNKGLRLRKTTGKYYLVNKINAVFNKLFLLFFLDENYSWSTNVYKELERIHADHPIDLLISSFSPLSVLIAGEKFIKENKGVRWVLDMRDELSSSPFIGERRRTRLIQLEKELLKRCQAVVSVSKPIVNLFKKTAESVNAKLLFSEIRNGFNFELDTTALQTRNEVFTVAYLGSFYASRKPTNFFKALTALIEEGSIDKENIKICFWSAVKSYTVPSALNDVVFSKSSISEAESVLEMQRADALLLVHPSNAAKGVFTGKLFEYLGSCRPVLALVDPEDVAAQLVRKCKGGWVAPNESITQIKEVLLAAYNSWLNKEVYQPNLHEIKRLHRKIQIEKLDNEIISPLLN